MGIGTGTPAVKLDVRGVTRIGDGTNYIEVGSDGMVRLIADATAWEDLRFSASLGKPGAAQPDWTQFKDDGSGSTGVFTYLFDKTTEEELFFIVQLPHAWKQGSDIYPHVHWTPTDTDTGSVVWGLEYTWVNFGGTFGNTTLLTVTDAADGTAFKHQIASFAAISGSGKTLSSVLLCRIYRKAGDGSDDYDADAALLEFDIHYEVDAFGSDSEFVKA